MEYIEYIVFKNDYIYFFENKLRYIKFYFQLAKSEYYLILKIYE